MVEATGEPGAGTTVTIRLPLAPVTNEMSEAEDPQLI
jgi:signal transduction histidine kinase